MSVDQEQTAGSDEPQNGMISDSEAEDHATLLGLVAHGLAELGYQTLLTDYYGMTLRPGDFSPVTRAEPTLDVFWLDERDDIALTMRVLGDFFDWGSGKYSSSDVLGTVGAVADELKD